MDKQLRTQLLTLINHILATEATHYEESGEPDDHIYALALEAQVQLTVGYDEFGVNTRKK